VSLLAVLLDVRPEGCRIEHFREPQGSRERSATLRQRETCGVAVQVRTTSARTASRVRKQGSLDRDDAQQVRLRGADPAPNTGADRLNALGHFESLDLLIRVDVDSPASEPIGEAGILALLANR
jgi:hypothetical protein